MKKKIVVFYGFIGFVGVLIGIVAVFVLLATETYENTFDAAMLLLLMFLLFCLLFYLIHTRFWSQKTIEIKMIEYENEILKMQIEREELKEKLKKIHESV